MGIKKWVLPEHRPEDVADLAGQTGLSPLVCSVLLSRSIDSPEKVREFLAEEAAFDDPMSLAGMAEAVDRITLAVQEGERIAVYGDYDCDGVTSTALLTGYLQSVGADVFYYIPDRETEGYGMNRGSVDEVAKIGATLLVTVDNGISAHEEIAYAKTLGIDVVVTDHHTPRETLPEAAAVVNPHRADCPSVFKDLAGVGVAFLLLCALEEAEPFEMLEHCSDLVALGTIADVVPLRGENRAIVQHGLLRLSDDGARPGIAALREIAGLEGEISAQSAAFGLAPRINAAGRLGSVDDAVQLLMTDDAAYAAETAAGLNALNVRRKELEERIMTEIERKIARMPHLLDRRVLLLSGRGWHHGVVGIAASRVMERYGKPCILFSVEEGEARGSGRSIEGFSLIEAITACSDLLLRYGGHVLAAGLTLKIEHLAEFGERIERFAARTYERMPSPLIRIDSEVAVGDFTIENVERFAVLEPFGAENPPPQLLLRGLTVRGIYPTTGNRHLRLRLGRDGHEFTAVYFRMSEPDFPFREGDRVDAVVQAEVSVWNGTRQLSAQIRDLRPDGLPEEEVLEGQERYMRHRRGEYDESHRREDYLPMREDFAKLYRLLQKKEGPVGIGWLHMALSGTMGYDKLRVALDVLEELELLGRVGEGAVRLGETQGKVELSASKILEQLTVGNGQ